MDLRRAKSHHLLDYRDPGALKLLPEKLPPQLHSRNRSAVQINAQLQNKSALEETAHERHEHVNRSVSQSTADVDKPRSRPGFDTTPSKRVPS